MYMYLGNCDGVDDAEDAKQGQREHQGRGDGVPHPPPSPQLAVQPVRCASSKKSKMPKRSKGRKGEGVIPRVYLHNEKQITQKECVPVRKQRNAKVSESRRDYHFELLLRDKKNNRAKGAHAKGGKDERDSLRDVDTTNTTTITHYPN